MSHNATQSGKYNLPSSEINTLVFWNWHDPSIMQSSRDDIIRVIFSNLWTLLQNRRHLGGVLIMKTKLKIHMYNCWSNPLNACVLQIICNHTSMGHLSPLKLKKNEDLASCTQLHNLDQITELTFSEYGIQQLRANILSLALDSRSEACVPQQYNPEHQPVASFLLALDNGSPGKIHIHCKDDGRSSSALIRLEKGSRTFKGKVYRFGKNTSLISMRCI